MLLEINNLIINELVFPHSNTIDNLIFWSLLVQDYKTSLWVRLGEYFHTAFEDSFVGFFYIRNLFSFLFLSFACVFIDLLVLFSKELFTLVNNLLLVILIIILMYLLPFFCFYLAEIIFAVKFIDLFFLFWFAQIETEVPHSD